MTNQKYWKLFTSILFISACTFGGGMAMIAMMQRRFVKELHWMDEEEMLDITAMAQTVPGSNFTNAAIMVGYRVGGIGGALAAITAAVLPPMLIISLIVPVYGQLRDNHVAAIFLQVMRAGVAAYIVDMLLGMIWKLLKSRSVLYILMAVAVFLARMILNMNISVLFLACLGIGVLDVLIHCSRREAAE